MKKENDKWINILKEKISSHAEPIADKSWEKLENQIRLNNLNKRRQYIKLLSTAACIVILLGLGIYLINNDNPQIDTITKENNSTKVLAENNENYDIDNKIDSSDNNSNSGTNNNSTNISIDGSNNKDNYNSSNNSNNNSSNSCNSSNNTNNTNNISNGLDKTINDSNSNSNSSSNSSSNKNNINSNYNRDNNSGTSNKSVDKTINNINKNSNINNNIYHNSNSTFKSAKGKLAIAIYSKTGGKIGFNDFSSKDENFFSSVSIGDDSQYRPSKFEQINYPPLYLENNQSSNLKPRDPRPDRTYNYDYKFPISFGISLQKVINEGLSIESGVMFTKLITRIDNDNSSKQKLWYIGIPAKISYKILRQKSYNIYISGGGAIELCMHAQYSGNFPIIKAKDMPFQFSYNASTGAEFNISPLISLYLEPGVSRYIKDKNAPETIRKKNPTLLNINAGLRFSL